MLSLLSLAVAIADNITNPFVSGTDGYHTFRIPSLLRLSSGDLLLFAEGRKLSSADHDWNDIVTKRSTDQGMTWGPLELVHSESNSSTHITIGNPAPVELTSGGAAAGTLLLVFTRFNLEVGRVYSYDFGQTWGAVTYFTDQLSLRPGTSHIATGPPTSIQLPSGRIVVPAAYCMAGRPWMTCGGATELGSFTLLSDDLGVTWFNSTKVDRGNECQAAQCANGSLLLSMRSVIPQDRAGRDPIGEDPIGEDPIDGPNGGDLRLWSWSDDEGSTWSKPTAANFNGGLAYGGGACQGSVVSLVCGLQSTPSLAEQPQPAPAP